MVGRARTHVVRNIPIEVMTIFELETEEVIRCIPCSVLFFVNE